MKQPSNTGGHILLRLIGLLTILIIVVMLVGCAAQGSTSTATQSSEPAEAEPSYPEIARVSLEDAKAAFDSGEAVFVDVRSKDSYDQSRIKDALSIPLNDLQTRMGELDPNQWIITYCT